MGFTYLLINNSILLRSGLKMFLKPVWEGKMHGVTKIGIFRPLFCVENLLLNHHILTTFVA